jgi:hypothetical protein
VGAFRYSPFQFTAEVRVRQQTPALLFALAENRWMTPAADIGGWTRLQWLHAPRASLSERDLAAAAPHGLAPDAETLSGNARTAVMVFVVAPAAVIALARYDAAYVRGDFGP